MAGGGQLDTRSRKRDNVSVTELPRGTVTFLFTDIEGSTRLLRQLGTRYGAVLAEHQRIVREAAGTHEGREVDTQGDSFFFAFARANAALGAAVVAQRSLAEHEWPEGVVVRVRMGLHTGEPAVGEERYVGLGVHRAARIGSVGHGGQVLLSSATRELVEDDVGAVSVRELGSYRLKDIDRPERLFQLDIEGLQTDFPPLRAQKVAEPRPLRRRSILLAALAAVIAAAVATPVFVFWQGGTSKAKAAAGNSLGIVDSGSGRLVGDVLRVGATPTQVAVGLHAYWVTNADGNSVSKIDPASKAVQTIPVGSSPSGITTGKGDVWVVNSLDGTVDRIDPITNSPVQTIPVGNDPVGIVYAAGSVWVANTGDNTITRINAVSGKPSKTLPIAATELAFGAGALWASESAVNQVVRIDPESGKVMQQITVGAGPSGIAFGDGAVWVANSLAGTVTRIDPATNQVTNVIPVGNGPTSVAVDKRGVWVSNQYGGTLVRIDLGNHTAPPIHVGNRLQGVAIAKGNVLVSVDVESGLTHRGGTLTLRSALPAKGNPIDSIDTAVSYSPPASLLLRMAGDGLVGLNQASGLAGTQIVPDLAVSLPTPTDGGRTYTFTLRPGIRYSNGKPVRASDFRATFERDFEIGLPTTYYDGILGANHCTKKRCDLSRGIVADDATHTVTFHLRRPDPEFLNQLELPFAYVLPAGTPPHDTGTRPLPATGPYAIATYQPRSELTLVRNRYFHEWSKAAQPDGYPDKIVLRIRGTPKSVIADVLHKKADLFLSAGSWTQGEVADLKIRHGSQVHTNPLPATEALFLNTRVPPFNRLDVRRALNYAADREAAIKANGALGRPTCQILPPDFPGYRPYCPYTAGSTTEGVWTAPNPAKALALVRRSGTRGMKVTLWAWTQAPNDIAFAAKLLRSLGYRVSTKFVGDNYFGGVGDSRHKAQIGWVRWTADYPASSGFLNPLFTCKSFIPDSPTNLNEAEFCDRSVDRQIERAASEQATNPAAARNLWQRIDREVSNQAPWVPLFNPEALHLLSKRVGNYQYSPNGFGVIIDQLWVH
jgi:YVTN family beta-propeller protein